MHQKSNGYPQERSSPYKVPGYSNSFNMWEKICNISKAVMPKAPGEKDHNIIMKSSALDKQYYIHLLSSTKLRLLKAHLID